MMATQGQDWPTPADFPDLRDISVIARGAHATVYGAYQLSAQREVALKIDNRTLPGDGGERHRFQQEARAVGRLSRHPGIIDTYVAGFTSQGRPYMVTELCQGSYADRIGEIGPLLPDEVKRVGVRIADALAEAHENRILHRDIKPANVLIDRSGQPVLADFGVASLMDSRVGQPVVRAAMTPAYAPLEIFQLRPSGEPGDVYSLAATLYAMLSGRPPRFPEDDRNFTIDHVMGLFSDPIGDIPGVSQTMLSMLRAAMTNNPEGRPSASQFRDMLDSVPVAAATGMNPRISPPYSAPPAQYSPTMSPPFGQFSAPPFSAPPASAAASPVPFSAPPASAPPISASASAPPVSAPLFRSAPVSGTPAPFSAPPAQRRSDWAEPVTDSGQDRKRRPSPSPRPRHASWGVDDGSRPAAADPSQERLPMRKPPPGELATRRERRIASRGGKETTGMGQLILVGAIAATLIVAGVVFAVWTFTGDSSTGSQNDAAEAPESCAVEKFKLGCLEKPLCFEGELVDEDDLAAAKEVSCESDHEWEAYATGELTGDIEEPTYGAVSEEELVQDTCLNEGSEGPLTSLKGLEAPKWYTRVLPPTPEDFEDGSKTFYCVAGPKDNEPTSGSAFSLGSRGTAKARSPW